MNKTKGVFHAILKISGTFLVAFIVAAIIGWVWNYFATRPQKPQANERYEVTSYFIKAKVNPNGTLDYHRIINYHFNIDAHGVILRQALPNERDNYMDRQSDYFVGLSNSNFDKKSLRVKINDQQYHVKNSELDHDRWGLDELEKITLHHKVQAGQNLKVELNYRIKNAVHLWKDTAELNTYLIGERWTAPINRISAEVDLPGKNVKRLKAYAHGPLAGRVNVNAKTGKIRYKLRYLPAEHGLETRILFPKKLVPEVIRMVHDFEVYKANINKNNKNRIKTMDPIGPSDQHDLHFAKAVKQEEKWQKEADQKRKIEYQEYLDEQNKCRLQEKRNTELKQTMQSVLVFLALIAFLLLSYNAIKSFFWEERLTIDEIPLFFDTPDVSPEQAQVVMAAYSERSADNITSYPTGQSLSAHLLELVGQHQLKMVAKNGEYRFTVTEKTPKEDILDFLLQEVGNGSSFSKADIDKFNEQYTSNRLYEEFTSWQDTVRQEIVTQDIFQADNRHLGWGHLLGKGGVCLAIVALFLVWPCCSSKSLWLVWLYALVVALSSAMVKICFNNSSPFTAKGQKILLQILGLREVLNNIGNFKRKVANDIILWGTLLPYAVALGISDKVIKDLKVKFGSELKDTDVLYDNIWFDDYFNVNDLNNSFDQSIIDNNIDTSSSSSDGGWFGSDDFSGDDSGGFSGGDSGGWGGSGGGDIF